MIPEPLPFIVPLYVTLAAVQLGSNAIPNVSVAVLIVTFFSNVALAVPFTQIRAIDSSDLFVIVSLPFFTLKLL